MSSVADRYHEVALSYFQAALRIWPSERHLQYDHLLAPALQCTAYTYELALKCCLLRAELSVSEAAKFGHDLWEMWNTEPVKQKRKICQAEVNALKYPEALPESSSNFDGFIEQFEWLSKVHSGQGQLAQDGLETRDFSLRYRVAARIQVYPPDFLLSAADPIVGVLTEKTAEDFHAN